MTSLSGHSEAVASTKIEVGRVTKAHGLRGEVRAFFLSGVPYLLGGIREVAVEGPDGFEEARIERIRPRGHGFVLSLSCCRDRDRAELLALAGAGIWVERRLLPAFPDKDFFWRSTVGLEVRLESGRGRKLGRVAEVFAAGAGDILVVRGAGPEYLIPARPGFVARVDEAVVVTPPEGLLEIYEEAG